jgi:hypothetical protein
MVAPALWMNSSDSEYGIALKNEPPADVIESSGTPLMLLALVRFLRVQRNVVAAVSLRE